MIKHILCIKLVLFLVVPTVALAGTADKARKAVRKGLETAGASPTSAAANSETAVSSINTDSAKQKKSLDIGTVMNFAASGALITACFAPKPNNYALCAMGLQAAAQAMEHSDAANQAKDVNFKSGGWDDYNRPGAEKPGAGANPLNPSGAADGSGYNRAQVEAAKKALEDAGYGISEKGLTSPNGTFVPNADLASTGALAAAGMSPAAIAEAQEVLAAVNDELSKAMGGRAVSVGVVEGGGGGASTGEGSEASESEAAGLDFSKRRHFALNAKQRQSLVAGKTKNLEGEPIGVRGQNIFEMMHVAYQRRRESNIFLDLGSGSAKPPRGSMVRTPANQARPQFKTINSN